MYAMTDGYETKVTRANAKVSSLRSTIPSGICRQFKLNEGDKLSWTMEVRDGELIIVVKPVKKE
jgi:bifunctional DNA-binding transcriptional regulator/antitoxin component of YhaV-PrlF toxin-antitoxin module